MKISDVSIRCRDYDGDTTELDVMVSPKGVEYGFPDENRSGAGLFDYFLSYDELKQLNIAVRAGRKILRTQIG